METNLNSKQSGGQQSGWPSPKICVWVKLRCEHLDSAECSYRAILSPRVGIGFHQSSHNAHPESRSWHPVWGSRAPPLFFLSKVQISKGFDAAAGVALAASGRQMVRMRGMLAAFSLSQGSQLFARSVLYFS